MKQYQGFPPYLGFIYRVYTNELNFPTFFVITKSYMKKHKTIYR